MTGVVVWARANNLGIGGSNHPGAVLAWKILFRPFLHDYINAMGFFVKKYAMCASDRRVPSASLSVNTCLYGV